MASFGFDLPNINGNTLKDEKERRQVMEYLFQLTEQLKHTLTHLDEDNMTESFKEEIQSTGAIKSFERKLESTDGQLRSVLKQTAEGFKLYVKKDDVISAINQSAEMVGIDASKILLEGYVSINGTFSVDEQGYLHCLGGTLGAFSVDSTGAIMGNGKWMVGNMTFDGSSALGLERARNLLITPDNIDYLKGTSFVTGDSYLLGIVVSGWPSYSTEFAVGTPYVDIDGTRYYIGLESMGGAEEDPDASKVPAIRITSRGDSLRKRTSPSLSASTIGNCRTNEMYQATVADAWAYCTKSIILQDGIYYAINLETPFYCAMNETLNPDDGEVFFTVQSISIG